MSPGGRHEVLAWSRSIPVLAYHSISPGERLGPDVFATHLAALVASRLPSLGPAELGDAQRGFLLTFDDGFADVWTHGLPLLRKYGIKATVFVIPSRTGEGRPRPQGEVAWAGTQAEAHKEASRTGGPHPAFLRWSELEALEATGLVKVQSHSWSHRMAWVGDRVLRFHRGRAHWSLAQCTGGDEREGIPLYQRGSALAHRLFFDDQALRDRLAEAHKMGRGDARLWAEVQGWQAQRGAGGIWETEEERRGRTLEEISKARTALSERLGGRRDELCLPWGEFDEVTLECARRAGVRRVYSLGRGPNPAGRIGFVVNRFEPRPRGPLWLRFRLWIYRSIWRTKVYGMLS